jgi:hypothetical protein
MTKIATGWKVYFPDDDQGPEDAVEITCYEWRRVCNADAAADEACEYDYDERDGWERSMSGGSTPEFPMVIISPDGTESRYVGWHEPSVEHNTRCVDGDEDRDGVQDSKGAGRPDQSGAGQKGADGQAGCLNPAEG